MQHMTTALQEGCWHAGHLLVHRNLPAEQPSDGNCAMTVHRSCQHSLATAGGPLPVGLDGGPVRARGA
jgi:hypothetical protein